MPNEWRAVAVSDVATPVIGGTPSRAVAEYWGGEVLWASAEDVVSCGGRHIVRTAETITKNGIVDSAAKVMPKGTVVVTARGTVGAVAQLGADMSFNQTCYGFIPGGRVTSDFLYYALRTILVQMHTLSHGAVFQTITTRTFEHLRIPLPPLPEQHSIARVLGALDDKIELNRKMNETLEQMARATFKACFTYPYEGLPMLMAGKQPPSPLPLPLGEGDRRSGEGLVEVVDSPLGKIPKGWRVGTVADVCSLVHDSITPLGTPNEEFAHFSIPAYDVGKEPALERGCDIKSNKNIVPAGSVLLSKLNPRFPRAWYVDVPPNKRAIASTEFLVAIPIVKEDREYLYSLFTCEVFVTEFERMVTGTSSSHQRVPPNSLLSLACVVPDGGAMQSYGRITRSMLAQVQQNTRQSRTLAAIRDALLPKLMSGEVRVKETGSSAD